MYLETERFDRNEPTDEQVNGSVDSAASVPSRVRLSEVVGHDLHDVLLVVLEMRSKVDVNGNVARRPASNERTVQEDLATVIDALELNDDLSSLPRAGSGEGLGIPISSSWIVSVVVSGGHLGAPRLTDHLVARQAKRSRGLPTVVGCWPFAHDIPIVVKIG
jgi:hypothetical protein